MEHLTNEKSFAGVFFLCGKISYDSKNAPQDTHSREGKAVASQHALGGSMSQATSFFVRALQNAVKAVDTSTDVQ